jgi:hypothetical protein
VNDRKDASSVFSGSSVDAIFDVENPKGVDADAKVRGLRIPSPQRRQLTRRTDCDGSEPGSPGAWNRSRDGRSSGVPRARRWNGGGENEPRRGTKPMEG